MTTSTPSVRDPHQPGVRRRKLIGLAFMAPPMLVFGIFSVAEAIGLEPGWWGHLIQLALAVLLVVAAWVRPRIGGPLLIAAGTALALWALLGDQPEGFTEKLSPLLIVAAPLVVAGIFFTIAGRVGASRETPSD